jgi:hypothetical protein
MTILCINGGRLRLKCVGKRAETRFRLSAKRTSPSKSAGASVQSTTGGRGVRISGSIAEYTTFRGSVKGTGYPLHLPVSPSLSPPVRRLVPSGFKSTLLAPAYPKTQNNETVPTCDVSKQRPKAHTFRVSRLVSLLRLKNS